MARAQWGLLFFFFFYWCVGLLWGAIILIVSSVSHSDFGSTLFVAPVSHGPLGFCNLARCTTAVTAGLKIRAYDRVDFYNHYTYIPVQKLRDIQIYRGRCCKTGNCCLGEYCSSVLLLNGGYK